MTGKERVLSALANQPVDRLPVWMMRQAGRYLPDYQKLRRQFSFMEMVASVETSLAISVEPVDVLDVDAAIVFHDILIPYQLMGLDVEFIDGVGPIIDPPIRSHDDIARLAEPQIDTGLAVVQTLKEMQNALGNQRALFGFAGAPFTLATYGIEGRSNKARTATRAMLAEAPDVLHALMDRLAPVVAGYLIEQARYADVLQIFESHADMMTSDEYETIALPSLREVVRLTREGCPDTPIILFAQGTKTVAPFVHSLGVDACSVDQNTTMQDAVDLLSQGHPRPVIQGNFDPDLLLQAPEAVHGAAQDFLQAGAAAMGHAPGSGLPAGWIVNLGHGVKPPTSPDAAKAFVDCVHGFTND